MPWNSHANIIPPEQFELVQELLRDGVNGKKGVFSGKVKCGDCGNAYGPKVWHSTDKYRKDVWQCNGKFKNKCKTPTVTEEEVKKAFVSVLNGLLPKKGFYVTYLTEMMESISDISELESERQEVDRQLEIDWKAVNDVINENARVVQNQKEYEEKYEALMKRYKETEERQRGIVVKINDLLARRKKIERFIETVKGLNELIGEFDQTLWTVLVESVTVEKERMVFRFNGGVEVPYLRS